MANTKIDSIKLSGSTEIYDIDLPSTATPSIAGLTTSELTVNGNVTTSGDTATINGNTSVSVTGSVISLSSRGRTNIYTDTIIELNAYNRVMITASNTTQSTYNTMLSLRATNINFVPYNQAVFSLPPTASTTTRKSTISLVTSEFVDNNSPCISLLNYMGSTVSVTGKIGITPTQGIGLLKLYNGSAGNNTYLTVSDNGVHMGVTYSTGYSTFATFGEKFFTITLSQNLLDDGADPFMRINGTLSNFTLEFPTAQTDITIDENNVILNRITPKITTSTGYLIAYPGCGYTSTSSYTIPAVSGIRFTRTNYGESIANTLTGSSLSMHNEFKLTGDDHGAIYQIYGQENRQYGELRVALSTNNSDAYSYAAVTGESAYWGASKLCLTVAIPAGRTAYLWGKNITSLYYSKTSLTVSQNIVTI